MDALEKIDYRAFGETVSTVTCLKNPFRGANQVKTTTGHFYFARNRTFLLCLDILPIDALHAVNCDIQLLLCMI